VPTWTLATLDGRHDYRSDHAALAAVALSVLNSGQRFWDFCHLATDPSRDLAARYVLTERGRERAPHRRERLLRRTWEKAQAMPPPAADPFAVRRKAENIRRAAERDTWTGQAGTSDLAALDAVLTFSVEQRTMTPVLGCRAIAERTGLTKSSAARALHRLVTRGYLHLAEKAQGENASTYRLTAPPVPAEHRQDGTPSPEALRAGSVSHLVGVGTLTALSALDAFARGALGRTAARVLSVLGDVEGSTLAQIAQATGISPRTLERVLPHLYAVGAVSRVRQGRAYVYAARLDVLDLDEVAQAYGTAGRSERMAEQHERERQGYARYRELRPAVPWQDRREYAVRKAREARAARLRVA
jgi:DNA-binding MarR family transcriptional regulator